MNVALSRESTAIDVPQHFRLAANLFSLIAAIMKSYEVGIYDKIRIYFLKHPGYAVQGKSDIS